MSHPSPALAGLRRDWRPEGTQGYTLAFMPPPPVHTGTTPRGRTTWQWLSDAQELCLLRLKEDSLWFS